MNLDDELRSALGREDPSPDFAARVMARLAGQQSRPHGWQAVANWFRPPRWRWAGAVALIGLTAIGIGYQRERAVRAQGEHAKEQVMLALRITGAKLQLAQHGVQRISEVR